MILLVVGIFLGLAFILVRNWREGEQMNSALEHKVQERTAELAYERKLYHSLIEAMPFPVFRKDREGHITYGNSHLWPALGYTEQEAMGKTDHGFHPGSWLTATAATTCTSWRAARPWRLWKTINLAPWRSRLSACGQDPGAR